MGYLSKEKITVGDDIVSITIEFKINVNTEGLFTTLLDEGTARLLENQGIRLYPNPRKNTRTGFFSSQTKKGLIDKVFSVAEEFCSKELIEEKIVLKYSISTYCSFFLTTKGDIIPNGSWDLDGEPDLNKYWQGGNVQLHSNNQHPTGILLYVKPFSKKIYQYKSGRKREVIDVIGITKSRDLTGESDYNLKFLASICSMSPPSKGELKELDYTEERAAFFVNLWKKLCLMSSKISDLTSPKNIDRLISSQQKLLP